MKAPNAPALVGVVPAGTTAATTTVLPGSVVWPLVFRMPRWLTVFADVTENSNPMWKASFEPFEKLFTVKASWEFWACAIPAPGNPTKINRSNCFVHPATCRSISISPFFSVPVLCRISQEAFAQQCLSLVRAANFGVSPDHAKNPPVLSLAHAPAFL